MISRSFFSIFLLFSIICFANGQDTIVLLSGDEIECYHVHLKNEKVNYKINRNDLDSSILSIEPSKVLKVLLEDGSVMLFGDEVKNADKYEISASTKSYAPGVPNPILYPIDSKLDFKRGIFYNKYYVNNEKVKMEKFNFELSKSQRNYNGFMRARRLDNGGKTAIDFGSFLGVATFVGNALDPSEVSRPSIVNSFYLTSGAFVGTGIIASLIGNHFMKKNIQGYNNIEVPELGFEGTKNGYGLVFRF